METDTKGKNYRPRRKVVGAAVVTVLVWVITVAGGPDVPGYVAAAMTTIAAYLIPDQ